MTAARRTVAALLAVGVSATALAGCSSSESPSSPATSAEAWSTEEVAIDGGIVSVRCTGSGTPVVWLVSDIATTGEDGWASTDVPEELAGRTRVCTYDRPGLGASDAATSDRSVEHQADELASIIEASGEATPVVVAGQGYGTFITRLFAQRSLPLVAGMVLVDPTLWTIDDVAPDDATAGQLAEFAGIEQINADLGGYGGAALPPPPAPTIILGASHLLPERPDGTTSTAGTAADGTVAGASLQPPEEERHERQRGLANKSPFGEFRLVPDAGSSIQHWDPAAVVAAIEDVLDSPDLKG